MSVQDEFLTWRAEVLAELKEKPLSGRRIVVTRAAEQTGELREKLESLGAEVFLLPLIRFTETADTSDLDRALRDIAEFDWLMFASANAAEFVARRADFLKLRPAWRASKLPKVAVVGPGTASAATGAGFPVEFVATGRGARGLASEIALRVEGARVLLPRSDRADDELPRALRKAGAEVTDVIAYRTEYVDVSGSPILALLAEGELDAVTLASPSAFHALRDALGVEKMKEISRRTVLAAIGPTTASAIRGAGLSAAIEADEQSATGLAQAVARHLSARALQRMHS
jgi:uroporphyrinogen-III synthase